MKSRKQNNEIYELTEMLKIISDNISETDRHTNTDSLFFNLLQTTEKNYFTTIEREDIFLIACHIQNMNDEIFSSESKLRQNTAINTLLKDCIEMLSELEKLPKCNSITNLYAKFRQHYNDTVHFDSNAKYCKKIADSIYFSYLKNT